MGCIRVPILPVQMWHFIDFMAYVIHRVQSKNLCVQSTVQWFSLYSDIGEWSELKSGDRKKRRASVAVGEFAENDWAERRARSGRLRRAGRRGHSHEYRFERWADILPFTQLPLHVHAHCSSWFHKFCFVLCNVIYSMVYMTFKMAASRFGLVVS